MKTSKVPRNLQLFLAKMADHKWLSSSTEDVQKLKEGKITPLVEWLTSRDLELQGEDPISGFLANMESPQFQQTHVLVVAALEINDERRTTEDVPDGWIKAVMDEQIAVLPSTCEVLREHLLRALRIKIPINLRLFQFISTHDTTGECISTYDKLFEPKPREPVSDITLNLVGSSVAPHLAFSDSPTEQTYIHFWDFLIMSVATRVTKGCFQRHTNWSSSTGLARPDFCYYYNNSNVHVFRGEEKASGLLEVSIKELYTKLIWRYDNAPYIFGYAAVAMRVCLVVIRKDEMTEHGAKVEIIEGYNLNDLEGRLWFFLALLNLATLFRPVVKLIEPMDILEYGILRRGNGVQISFAGDCAVKTYPADMPSDTIIRNLKNLHRLMKESSVPNVVELRKTNMRSKHVKLSPIGRLAAPENVRHS